MMLMMTSFHNSKSLNTVHWLSKHFLSSLLPQHLYVTLGQYELALIDMQGIRPGLCTDLTVPLCLSVLTVLLLLTLLDCKAAPGQGRCMAAWLSDAARLCRALKPLQDLHQQEVCRKLLHRPGWDRDTAQWTEQLGVGRLVPVQAGHTESVLAGQHLGWHIQLLQTQRTLQQRLQRHLLHFKRAPLCWIHHTERQRQQWRANSHDRC